MPFCNKCGNKLTKEDVFCPECGTPVKAVTPAPKFEEPVQDEFKTQIRADKHVYGVVNLENLPKDHIIDERYEIKEKLGQGGFGAVYLAYDQVMGIDKALKIIPEAVSSDKEAMFDLQQEARTMIALNHSNIVRVYNFHNSGNIKYIDMEYVDGKTLSEIKLEYPDKCVPEERVKKLAIKIAEGMAYVHESNVLHEDIKPQNIKENSKGEIKIMDFGIAETVRTSMSRLQNSSSSGTLVYMSPEQILGKNVGRESDIYSFGALIYELLSGHPPFYRGDISYQILNVQQEKLIGISQSLSNTLEKCLEKDYQNRIKDFESVIMTLQSRKDKATNIKIIKDETEQKPVKLTNIVSEFSGIEMVYVEGGEFDIGSNNGVKGETPVHRVKLGDLLIGKYPITQEQYEKVTGKNPSRFKGIDKNMPVERVTWYDAIDFCNKMSKIEGLNQCYSISDNDVICDFEQNGYRLPLEAEWGFAAQSGNNKDYFHFSGSENIDLVCWYNVNSNYQPQKVGLKNPNKLGIYDMSGNVWEWCWDRFGNFKHTSEHGVMRLLKGGSWLSNGEFCKIDYRLDSYPKTIYSSFGFRLVRNK